MKNKIPTILLIGVGRFGERHLQTLQILEKRGVLKVAGAVVRTEVTKNKIEKTYGIPVWVNITPELLKKVDAVDIVTPPETHYDIAMRCLPFTSVLIEKPLAVNTVEAEKIASEAKKYGRAFMVGHIFRFNPAVKKLKSLLAPFKNEDALIKGTFINPVETYIGRSIALELPHLFDIVDFVLELTPGIVSSKTFEHAQTVDIQYSQNKHATFTLGWQGNKKIRTINFLFSKNEIRCDLINNIITIKDFGKEEIQTIECHSEESPLYEEISVFLEVLSGKNISYPDSYTGIRLISIIEKIESMEARSDQARKLKVAIIGGGIFGVNCAIEISKFSDLTLFEKNNDIMLEASFVNQYRHHWGYHYPRSDKTVEDIRKVMGDFENIYDKAVVREFPTYYSISKSGSKTTAQEYLEFCNKHNLPFTLEYPDEKFLNREKISISLKTFEPIYNYDILKKITDSQLKKSQNLNIKLNKEVIDGKIDKDGGKILTIIDSSGNKSLEKFDYVINATYANYNNFSRWFNFPIKPVRIDLVEALIVKLPLPRISIAVMDGPFTNLVPTSLDGVFTLVHIKESMLERYVPENGLPYDKERIKTKIKETLEKSKEWIPILDKAEVLEVRYVHRAVNACREHDDARPSDTTYHGFGCWSILGGKIVNSVSTAKEIANEIKKINVMNPLKLTTKDQLDTPILLMIFNRPDISDKSFEVIRSMKPRQLFICADGPRKDRLLDAEKCAKAREIVTRVDWPCELKTLFQKENLGCGLGSVTGINWMFEHVDRGIIMDDDCLPNPSFFYFCQELLKKYENNPKIMHISGNNFQNGIKRGKGSYYFSEYTHNWGWATWARAWKYNDFFMVSPELQKHIWDKQWLNSVHKQKGLAILPNVNLVSNIGSGIDATHTSEITGYSNMPAQTMIFPLIHPKKIRKNRMADFYTYRKVFEGRLRTLIFKKILGITPKALRPSLQTAANIIKKEKTKIVH